MKNLFYLLLLVTLSLNSCTGSESDEGQDVVTYVKVFSSGSNIILGQTAKLVATDNLNNDVTSESTFYINGQLNAGGALFNPEHLGDYTITAKYKDFNTKPIKVAVIKPTGVNFVHRILYEDITGTWCGNCPIASVRYENLVAQNDKVVFLGVHGPTVKTDPFTSQAAMNLVSLLKIGEYPTILLNNTKKWTANDNNYQDMSFAIPLIKPFSKIGIAITTKLENNVFSGEYKVAFAENYSNLKTTVYIVENKIVYPQHNYFDGSGGRPVLFGGKAIVNDYVHHNVLRDALTPVAGTPIASSDSQDGSVYTQSFSYTIPADFAKENVKVMIVISDANNDVLNVREADINTINALETL
ncbi:Omp28-related outer membrane protein [Soonwooa sp.]|uniref:Omp28-related outer membrane protein n=1 Tax=Soonwooa sp. TaxID=1938592 RepID=UPI002612D370|nr:Omp28-related outer membrane protein [Soonwooa sp.]